VRAQKILLIDDEPDSLEMMRVWLCAEGYAVLAVGSGAEGLYRIGAWRPDLVIVDAMMPGMTGFELCDHLRNTPDTKMLPILMCSAHLLPPHSATGQYDYAITKPVDLVELMVIVRALLPSLPATEPEFRS
jgi:CheY-like chemotaxis protein